MNKLKFLFQFKSLFICFLFVFYPFPKPGLAETDLEEMALHETEDNKVFQRFKKKIAPEPHQVKTIIKKKNLNFKIWNEYYHYISIVCSGGALQSRRLSFVDLLTTHPLSTRCPTMCLWCPADFWVSGRHWLLKGSFSLLKTPRTSEFLRQCPSAFQLKSFQE